MKCILVLPCYNEKENIEPLISAIDDTLHQRPLYQVIAINNGSNNCYMRGGKELSFLLHMMMSKAVNFLVG